MQKQTAMTTGATGSAAPQSPTVGFYDRRVWTGTNGKYESYAGELRDKWNTLTLSRNVVRYSDIRMTRRGRRVGSGIPYTEPVGYSYGPQLRGSVSINDFSPTQSSALNGTLINNVLSKLLSNIKDSDFNLGVNLGQLRQTVDLLSSNLRKLGRAATALKRGDFPTAARALGARPRNTSLSSKDVSGRWLELQYGWIPLLSDSFDAAKAFEEISNGPRKRRFLSTASVPAKAQLSLSPTLLSTFLEGRHYYRIQCELYEEMSAIRQLGLTDPLSIAWELTPWSFVIDWFVPIGTYLSNLYQIPSLKGRFLVTKTTMAKSQRNTYSYPGSPTSQVWLGPGASVLCDHIEVVYAPNRVGQMVDISRSLLASPPTPPRPSFSFDGISNVHRLWNALALAHQRFR